MEHFESIVDNIYDAATEPECWPDALHKLSQHTHCAGGVILVRRGVQWAGWRASQGLMRGAHEFMDSDAVLRSAVTPRLLQADRAGFVTDRDLFAHDEEYRADPLITEWGAPNGFFHAAATAINTPSQDFIVVHVQRHAGDAAFSAADVAALDAFRPHLARAGLLAVRFQFEKLHAAARALDLAGLPAAILDRQGRVLIANDLIQALRHHVVWLPNNRLALLDGKADAQLRQGLAQAKTSRIAASRSFPLRPQGEGDRAVGHLIPVPTNARDLFEGGLMLLIVTPLGAHPAPDSAMLRGLFDLTSAEAAVANAVGRGLTTENIAKERGCALETVRTQVKSILAKTNTRRQSELAVLLGQIPKLPL